jgi:branched-chain amino acid transport system substrate-binding protein
MFKWLCLGGMLVLSACSIDRTSLEERRQQAETADKEAKTDKNYNQIIIGIAWTFDEAEKINLVTGAKFAVQEWNDRCLLNSDRNKIKLQNLEEPCSKFLRNRKIKIRVENDKIKYDKNDENISEIEFRQAELDKTYKIAQKFARDLNIIAVIGHRKSSQAISASITYEQHGMVFLAPTATNLALTNHNFKYVFRLMPNNEKLSIKMTDYFKDNNYKRVAILYERSTYAQELAETFMKNATNKFDIFFQQSFFSKEKHFTEILGELKEKSFLLDATFLAMNSDKACEIMKQAHALNIKIPFIGGDAIFKPNLEECLEAEGIVVPTILNKSKLDTLKKYLQSKKVVEDVEMTSNTEYQQAFLGYDAINLLINVINRIESTEPIKIANKLRYMEPWKEGILGEYAFKEDGDLKREDAINFAILCQTSSDPKKLSFNISPDSSLTCDTKNLTLDGNE